VDGRDWSVYTDNNGRVLTIASTEGGLTLSIRALGPDSRALADFTDLASHLQFAPNLADRGTWFEAPSALPH
jgi:hypothetical protein